VLVGIVVAFSNLSMQQADLDQVGAKKREECKTGNPNDRHVPEAMLGLKEAMVAGAGTQSSPPSARH